MTNITQTTLEQIELVLVEASAWGLRSEVDQEAKQLIEHDPELDPVEAYLYAYENWVK